MLKSYETERLQLKILNKDAAAMVLHFYEDNKPLFEPWEPKRSEHFYTQAYQKASLSAEYYQMADGKLLRYWVFLKDCPDEIIGSVCFQNFLMGPYRSCSIGYKFSHKFHNLGYAYESTRKGIDVIFEELPIHRIEAFIMPNNDPSLRLIKKLDFICEGISYAYANVDGVWTDHLRYALINSRAINPYASAPIHPLPESV